MLLESGSSTGGIQHTTLYLVEGLAQARWDPLVVCPEEGELPEACRRAGVAVKILARPPVCSTSFWITNRIKLPNPLAWLWDVGSILIAAHRVAGLLRQEQPDLLVTKGLLCHFYGGLAARMAGVPCLWHVEDFVSRRFGGIYRWVFAQAAGWLPSRLSVNGSPVLAQIPTGARRRTSVACNGVNAKIFRPGLDGSQVRRELGIEPGQLVIGNVARLTPWKGQDLLLDAYAQLVRNLSGTRLLLVGAPLFESPAFEHRLRSKVRDLELTDHVIFAGHRTDIPQVLAAMDIFAYTALEKDIWPLSLLQAMATGLPVVAFDIAGVREPIGDDENAVMVPVGQIDLFTQALRELAMDGELRRRLSLAARRRAESALTIERYVMQMEASFELTLLNQP